MCIRDRYKDGQLVETKQGDKVFTFQLPITGKHSIEARSGEHSSVILVNLSLIHI